MKRMKCLLCLLLCALFCAGCAAPEGDVMETKLTQYVIGQAEYPAYPQYVDPERFWKNDGSWDGEGYRKAEKETDQVLKAMGKSGGADAAAVLEKDTGVLERI